MLFLISQVNEFLVMKLWFMLWLVLVFWDSWCELIICIQLVWMLIVVFILQLQLWLLRFQRVLKFLVGLLRCEVVLLSINVLR